MFKLSFFPSNPGKAKLSFFELVICVLAVKVFSKVSVLASHFSTRELSRVSQVSRVVVGGLNKALTG